jgi:hypothetical protein
LKILNLREGATEGEVKAAYRGMSRMLPPRQAHSSGFSLVCHDEESSLNSFNICTNAHMLFTRDNVTNTVRKKKI